MRDTGEDSLRFKTSPRTRPFSDWQMPSVLQKNQSQVSPMIRSRRLGQGLDQLATIDTRIACRSPDTSRHLRTNPKSMSASVIAVTQECQTKVPNRCASKQVQIPLDYSILNALTGSMDAARCAGIAPATNAASARATIALAITLKSAPVIS